MNNLECFARNHEMLQSGVLVIKPYLNSLTSPLSQSEIWLSGINKKTSYLVKAGHAITGSGFMEHLQLLYFPACNMVRLNSKSNWKTFAQGSFSCLCPPDLM